MFERTILPQIQSLVARDELGLALELLTAHSEDAGIDAHINDCVVMQGRLESWRKDIRRGVVSESEIEIRHARLANSILDLAYELQTTGRLGQAVSNPISEQSTGWTVHNIKSTEVSIHKRFQVALSFSGEYRQFISSIAQMLLKHLGNDSVFYDNFYEHELARPDADEYLQNIYHNDCDLVVVFLCSSYAEKEWCGLEWRAVKNLIKKRLNDIVMLLRFDEVEIPGLFSTDICLDIRNRSASEVASLIVKRLQYNQRESQ